MIKMMMARTSEKSYLNNYKGEDWAVVREVHRHFPSGWRRCYQFPSGYCVKVELCETKEI